MFKVVLKDVTTAPFAASSNVSRKALTSGIQFNPATILLVDDVELARILLKGFLESSGFNIIEAENGKDAVETAKRHHPDLILMDMKMPVMDGYLAVKNIRNSNSKLSKTPIIAVTASAMIEEEEKALAAGCDGFLRKPVHMAELVKELMRFLPHSQVDPFQIPDDNVSTRTTNGFDAEQITQELTSKLPELIMLLENEMMNQWQRANNTFIISEIIKFAQTIKDTGEAYAFPFLSSYGEKLSVQAKTYDMEKLPDTLNLFPGLVNQISESIPDKTDAVGDRDST